MSLFTYPVKPYNDNESAVEDDDDEILYSSSRNLHGKRENRTQLNNKQTNRAHNIAPQTTLSLNSKSSTGINVIDVITNNDGENPSSRSQLIDLSLDNEDICDRNVFMSRSSSKKSSTDNNNNLNVGIAYAASSSNNTAFDEEIRKAQILLNQITSAKSNLSNSLPVIITPEIEICTADLKTTEYRYQGKQRPTFDNTTDISLNDISDLIGIQPSHNKTVNKAPEESLERKVKLKTRINGKLEKKWKLGVNDLFSKFKAKFCEDYGLSLGASKFILDGDVISDDESPESLDIEDDTIIDVKIPEDLFKLLETVPKITAGLPITTSTGGTIPCDCTDVMEVIIRVMKYDRGTNGTPTLSQLAQHILPMNRGDTLQSIETLLSLKGLIPINEFDFSSEQDRTTSVLDPSKTLAQLTPSSSSSVRLLLIPKRVMVTVQAMDAKAKKELKMTKPFKIVLRADYRVADISRSVSSHLKYPYELIRVFHMNAELMDLQRTLRSCGIRDGAIISIGSRNLK